MTDKTVILLSLAAIVIAGFAVYANSMGGDFLFDDMILIRDNTRIKDIPSAGKLFTESIAAGYRATKALAYRPIQMLTYMSDYALYKLDPRGYHFTNILFHVLAALALYALIRAITGDNFAALLTGLLFVTHPIHTEAVSYISGRADPLSAFFMLTSFALYVKSRGTEPRTVLNPNEALNHSLGSGSGRASGSWTGAWVKCLNRRNSALFLLSLFCYLLALLSRESALIFPALILIYHYSFRKKVPLLQFFSVTAVAAAHIIFRAVVIAPSLDRVVCKATLIQRIPGFFAALASYARLLVFPAGQGMEYGDKVFAFSDPAVFIGLGLSVIAVISLVLMRKSRGVVFFSVSWFFITILPQSNIYPVGAYMAEHWLYIPSIGFFLAVSVFLSTLWPGNNKRKLASAVIAVAMLSVYSYAAIRQNLYWKNAIVFYESTIKNRGENARVLSDSAVVYMESGRIEEAIVRLKRALELQPYYPGAMNNLGKAYYKLGRTQEAIALYKRAVEIGPMLAVGYSNLGVAYMDMGKKDEAAAAYMKAIQIDPSYADAIYNLAFLYSQDGRIKEAAELYERAIALNPDFWQAHINLSMIYYGQARYDQAIARCDSAAALGAKIDPAFLEALKPYRR